MVTVGDIQEQAEQLRSHQDDEIRRQAVIVLAGKPWPEIREPVFGAMGDTSWRVRKEAVDLLLSVPFEEGTVESLVDLLRSHDNAGLRNSAVEALERLGSLALPVLSRHAGDGDHDVRKFILDVMGNIGDPTTTPLLIGALDDPDPNVSAAAAENLGKLGDPSAVLPLVEALNRNDIWFRFTVLEALSRIGTGIPVEAVAALAEEKLLKKPVYDCLGSVGDEGAIPMLVSGLGERVKNNREAALVALMRVWSRLPSERAEKVFVPLLRSLDGSPVLNDLLQSFGAPDRGVQEAAIRIMGIIGDERGVLPLVDSCRDERLRRFCLEAFRIMGDRCAPALQRAFPTGDEEQRCIIAYLCGELQLGGSVVILDEGMRAESPLLRRVSVSAAGKSRQVALLDGIVTLLDDPDSDVRDAAVNALARFADLETDAVVCVAGRLATSANPHTRRDAAMLFHAVGDADRLALLAKDEDPMVRLVAVQSLASVRSAATANHLVLALVDEESEVRIAAANALGDVGSDDALDPLLLTLGDEDLWVKCAAMKSLARLGGERAFQGIAGVMQGADGLILITALEALARLGGERAFGLIRNALDHPDGEVVKTVVEILSEQDADWFSWQAGRLLSHPHWEVRATAARIVARDGGDSALALLRRALETEADDLVRAQLEELLDRMH